MRSEEHTSELQSLRHLVCRLLLEKKNKNTTIQDQRKRLEQTIQHSFRLDRLTTLKTFFSLFFFNDTATTEIYTLSLHDALPISESVRYLAARGGKAHEIARTLSKIDKRLSFSRDTEFVRAIS